MWDEILQLAISDGLWALLFCVLLIYELKDSRARETKYQNTISSLAKDLEYMKDIDEDIEDMNNAIREYMESVAQDNLDTKTVCKHSQSTSGAEERL
ncbi:MAG: hypothetical protein K2L70_00400 [Clostridia bacterium]|nr:hypothetical protein [Clostridia bacterium]